VSLFVSAPVLKAANLFTERPSRDFCRSMLELPWAMRLGSCNVVWASDGHTMFVANDREGSGYRKKPAQIGGSDVKITMPPWSKIVRGIPAKRRAFTPVAVNPRYHARVMRAAVILDKRLVTMSVGGAMREIVYSIGPDAFAIVMPMADADRPVVPEWLRKAVQS
jgi:hypothetical protein